LYALAGVLALALLACGRAAPAGPLAAPPPHFQALVVGAPDPQGNHTTLFYDSAGGRALTTLVPGNASEPRFAGAGRISYLLPGGVESADAADGADGSPRAEASDPGLLAAAHAWSSRSAMAYLAYPSSSHPERAGELVIRPARGRQATVSLPAAGAGAQLSFSPDGRLLLLVDPTTLQVRRLDGTLVFSREATAAGPPSDPVWANDGTLYFWDQRGVNATDPVSGATRTVLPGVRWYNPGASPDGRHLVFEVRDAQGLPYLRLLDAATGGLVSGFSLAGASHARFISPTELWYHEETVCDRCREPTRAADEIMRYDLGQRTERKTGVTGFVSDLRTVPGG
jgi:hypothetical protein